MLKHQDYTAWISVGDQPLETYAVETNQATNEVTCWIASEAGKEFSVHCRDTSPMRIYTVGVFVIIDGQDCGGNVLHNSIEPYPNVTDTVKKSDVSVSESTVKPFVFSAVRLTDEDDFADTTSASLGQIQIKVWRVAVNGIAPPRVYQLQTEHKVHERSKKAVTHCVGFGRETVVPRRTFIATRYIGQPVAIFTFKYRDANLLKANGVIPVPVPLKRKASEEIIDLTGHDVKIEGSRSNVLVRGERNSHRLKKTENRSKRVKEEQKPGGLVEVIDLT